MSSTPYLIPLLPTPQTLSITLAGVQYNLSVWWNNVSQNWMIDIFDINNNPIVTGIPMVTGVDLLEQFGYLGFGGQLIAQTTNDPDVVPTFADLGSTGNLYFVVPAEA
jgi:hypothetical protein